MRKQIKRAGLHVFEEWSSDDPREKMPPMPTNQQRLVWAEQEAKRYPDVAVLHREIDWVRRRIHQQSWAVTLALDSIQRGIWLLDTERYLPDIERGLRSTVSHRKSRKGRRGKIDVVNNTDYSNAEIYDYWLSKKDEHRNFLQLTADHFKLSPRQISNIVKEQARKAEATT